MRFGGLSHRSLHGAAYKVKRSTWRAPRREMTMRRSRNANKLQSRPELIWGDMTYASHCASHAPILRKGWRDLIIQSGSIVLLPGFQRDKRAREKFFSRGKVQAPKLAYGLGALDADRLLNVESIPRCPPLKLVGPLPLTRNRFQILRLVSIIIFGYALSVALGWILLAQKARYHSEARSSEVCGLLGS
jgi:hypothetical protein